jgi:hypothetical protein
MTSITHFFVGGSNNSGSLPSIIQDKYLGSPASSIFSALSDGLYDGVADGAFLFFVDIYIYFKKYKIYVYFSLS